MLPAIFQHNNDGVSHVQSGTFWRRQPTHVNQIVCDRLTGACRRWTLASFQSAFRCGGVQQATQSEERIVWGACSVNCGSRCALRLHVRDNEVTWVETDNTGMDNYGDHQVRACLRGRSIRRRINHPDRLNYPMKRVGKRGEGKFERISWEEALDIAESAKSRQRLRQRGGLH
jgi:anaerobic selenocysteine-containing dehydrogenase